MEDSLSKLIQNSLIKYSGTDEAHYCGVAAGSIKRRNTVKGLLTAATDILVSEGVVALTFRKLAGRCDMQVGTLQYYFPSREDLFRGVMRFILAGYLEALLDGPFLEAKNPEDRLRKFLQLQIEDVQKKRSCAIFVGLWDLAQRDGFVSDQLEEMYTVERLLLQAMLADNHPDADASVIADKAAVIVALLEGMMPIYGPATSLMADTSRVYAAAMDALCQISGIPAPTAP